MRSHQSTVHSSSRGSTAINQVQATVANQIQVLQNLGLVWYCSIKTRKYQRHPHHTMSCVVRLLRWQHLQRPYHHDFQDQREILLDYWTSNLCLYSDDTFQQWLLSGQWLVLNSCSSTVSLSSTDGIPKLSSCFLAVAQSNNQHVAAANMNN